MLRDSLPSRLLAAAMIGLLALFSVGFTWAAVDDYARREILPAGASVDGVPVGGLTYADAARVVEEKVKGPLLSPVAVAYAGSQTTLDPAQFVEVDVTAMLDQAARPKIDSTLPQRVWQRLGRSVVGRDVPRALKVDDAKLTEWARAEKKRVTVPAVDASVSVTGSKPKFRSAKPGSTINVTNTVGALSSALMEGTKSVQLVETTVTPKVTNKKLGKTIFVSRSHTTLTLYNGVKLEKAYRCAVGQPQFPTPLGWWVIERKVSMPSWHNNGSDWAKSMPDYIAPGPGNPLGTRALYLNAAGIRIHGIPPSEDWSIGSPASHGCMRMHRWDVEDLYPRVPVGTRVIIVP